MSNPSPVPVARRVLSVSRDPMLLTSRNAILQQAGYTVETTMKTSEALEIVRNGRVDAVVLGDSVSYAERNALAQAIREIAPKLPILVLKLASEVPPPEATSWMDSLDGPEALLAKLSEILRASDAQAA